LPTKNIPGRAVQWIRDSTLHDLDSDHSPSRLAMKNTLRLDQVRLLMVAGWILAVVSQAAAQPASIWEKARRDMIAEVIVGGGIKNERVIKAMTATPRHEFVSLNQRSQAYFDMALPIGDKQTISAPFIVAYMTESLDPQPTDKVLEIGTGSGYQAAVLSPLVKDVYSIEIVEPLGRKAERTLKRLNYANVHVKIGDGYQGWPEHAPFDKIIVTCSPESVPVPLAEQLREGGLMVIPVGERYQQTLYLLRKKDGKLESEALRPTLFVPMTGTAEQQRRVQPDPSKPVMVNGGFEEPADETEIVPGWYYQRQTAVVKDAKAPEGKQIVTIRNRDVGRAAHLMQGFPIDGRQVPQLEITAWMKHEIITKGPERNEVPMIAVSFYDEGRRELGMSVVGPFLGTADWHHVSRKIRIPPQTREGILRLGLFGATGEIAFDDVKIRAVAE
jgi:protein-L-isoaspartate(D-aspartate) O-methyltransferase